MDAEQVDFTVFWRRLSVAVVESSADAFAWRQVADLFLDQAAWQAWHNRYMGRLNLLDVNQCQERMYKVNPKYVLRNHLAQNAIELAQKKDFSEVARLLKILENPYESQAVSEDYAMGPPAELAHVAISCSS